MVKWKTTNTCDVTLYFILIYQLREVWTERIVSWDQLTGCHWQQLAREQLEITTWQSRHSSLITRELRLALQLGQLGSKWVKSWTFQDQFSVHFGSVSSVSQNEQKTDLKKSHICPIWGQSAPIWCRIWLSASGGEPVLTLRFAAQEKKALEIILIWGLICRVWWRSRMGGGAGLSSYTAHTF